MLALNRTPFPVTYRELWDPSLIRGTQLPPFKGDGHVMTLTGASKQTTTDGVHFTGAATSNIVVAAAAGQNAKAAFHITIRFKLDATFAAGAAANVILFQKTSVAEFLRIYLKSADGKLNWDQGGGFVLTSTTVSWTAGVWYIVTCELTDTPTQRLLVNGTAEDTDTSAAVATPNGGDMIIGSSSDGGTDGIVGVISWVVIGVGATATVALTANEETDLAKGIPPATAKIQYMYLFDEGRLGATLTNRGDAGVAAGTLDSACTWAFGQVRQPVLSLDGINDLAVSSTGVNSKEPFTLVYVAKIKSTYSALVNNPKYIYFHSSSFYVLHDGVETFAYGFGADRVTLSLTIDQYAIFHHTYSSTANKIYFNGALADSGDGGIVTTTLGTFALGSALGAGFDVSKVLLCAIAETEFTAAQAKAYSRWLRDIMNLPITI